jgi:TPR repeat protein
MKMLARCALPAALATALAASPARAQQNPGLATRPSGFTLDGTNAPAEQPIDLTRPNPQSAVRSTSSEELYFDAAMGGEAWAQTKLGKVYLGSSNDAEQQRKGIELLQKAAAQKDAEALYLLAKTIAAGFGAQPSNIAAMEKLQEAAELGHAEAQYELALMYAEGRGLPKDSDLALHWGKKAAEQGNNSAKYSLALALLARDQSHEFTSEAVSLLTRAANDGHRDALFFLAGAIAHGNYGLAKDEKKAAEIALPFAQAGDAEFQFALATLYLRGESFGGHRDEGIKWLKKAANNGQSQARQMLEEFTEQKNRSHQ